MPKSIAPDLTNNVALVAASTNFPSLAKSIPFVLGLNGTLLRSNVVLENLVFAIKRKPLTVFKAIGWFISGGKTKLKEKLAIAEAVDCDDIPVNADIEEIAQQEYRFGREIILATATSELLAGRASKRFGFISRVFSSNAAINLKGRQKANSLAAQFPDGFIYAGDSKADYHVWQKAAGALVYSNNSRLVRKVENSKIPSISIASHEASLRDFLKAIRLQHSVKNFLIFAPVLLAGKFGDEFAWLNAMLAFVAMTLVAAATYLFNDLSDLANDRKHWSKRKRALAAGLLPVRTALIGIPTLFMTGLMIASMSGYGVMLLTLTYAAISLLYSSWLKRIPLVDVSVIGGLFSLRLVIGVVAIGASFSTWLFVFATALFLSIALAKRHTELLRLKSENRTHAPGRSYVLADEPVLLTLGIGAAVAAVIFFALYLMSDSVRLAPYSAPQLLWIACPAIFLWIGRIWLLSQRGTLNDDPLAFAVKDKPSIILGLMVGLAFVLANVVVLPVPIA